jgi:hypothetical protein
MTLNNVNVWAVLVAGIVNMVIGAFWYSPLLFGKMWMKLSGLTDTELQKAKEKGMGKSYLIAFIGSLVMAFVLAHLLQLTNATSLSAGLTMAFWLWLGLIVTVLLSSVLWENKPWILFLINISHYLVGLATMSLILVSWV